MNIYQTFYDLIVNHIFGGSVVVGSHQELVCILVSTIACIFIIAIPFLVVWKVIKIIMG